MTRLPNDIKISDGKETVGVTVDKELIVNDTELLTTTTADYGGAQTDTTLVTPDSGKKVEIHQIYVSTNVTNVDIEIEFLTSEIMAFKLYTSNATKAEATTLHIVGATDEVLSVSCGAGSFVSVSWHNVD